MGAIAVTKVEPHPTDSNKLRVSFSEAFVVATAEVPGNYVFTPSLTPQYAITVAGSGDTQVDLHFGPGLTADGNTYAIWQFDELAGATAADGSGNGFTLTSGGGATITPAGLFKASRTYSGAANSYMQSAATQAPRPTLFGEWTIQTLVKMNPGRSDGGAIWSYSDAGATEATNFLGYIGVEADGGVRFFWETGAAVIQNHFSGPGVVPDERLVMLTGVKKFNGTNYDVFVYVNGKRVITGTNVPNSTGATSAGAAWAVGRLTNFNDDNLIGVVDVIKFSNVIKTEAQIMADTAAIVFPIASGTYNLQVSNVQDLATTTPITLSNGESNLYYRLLGDTPEQGQGSGAGAGNSSGFNQGLN